MGKVVTVSGGFDPIHVGHVKLIKEARKLGDSLVVILNNDNWLKKKKGYSFMNEIDRAEILKALEDVDDVLISKHSENPADMSVCNELAELKPDIFANGGDRKPDNDDLPVPEYEVCDKLGISMVFNIGGEKARSSSELVDKARK